LIAQYLAAGHPDVVERVALVASGAEVTAWAKRVDGAMARSLARRDLPAAGLALAE
jgi:hypothetical protein